MNELVPYPTATELEQTWKLAAKLARTEFVAKPMRGSPEAVLACILTGRELGIGPMQALRDIYLINGRPGMAATLMVSRVRARGHRFRTLENTDHHATVQIHRAGEPQPEPPVTFTIEDAKRAKLISKDVWQSYPARMNWARAASTCCRRDCPEVLGGAVYTPEELEDVETEATWGEAEVDQATGEVHEESPGWAVQEAPPAQPGVATSLPTHDQVERLRSVGDARNLSADAPPTLQAAIKRAAASTGWNGWDAFWRKAGLPLWKDVLHDAITEMSGAVSRIPPAAPAAPDQTSDPGRADRATGEAVGSKESATTPGSDAPFFGEGEDS